MGRRNKMCRNGSFGCDGNRCMRCGDQKRAERNERSTWTPRGSQNPDVGVVEGTDQAVSFKTGGRSGDDTLIADGDYSEGDGTGAKEARDAFRGSGGEKGHDHYGPWGGTHRGKYTGPNSLGYNT